LSLTPADCWGGLSHFRYVIVLNDGWGARVHQDVFKHLCCKGVGESQKVGREPGIFKEVEVLGICKMGFVIY